MGRLCECLSLVSLENQDKNLGKKNPTNNTVWSRAISAKMIYQFRIWPDVNTVVYALVINHTSLQGVSPIPGFQHIFFPSCELVAVIILRNFSETL